MPTTPPPRTAPSTILLGAIVLYAGVIGVYFRSYDGHNALAFSEDGVQNVGHTMAPLVAIACFIERAVELVIATWRRPGELDLAHAARSAAEGSPERDAANLRLRIYKLQTQRVAFVVGLALSLFASLVGVRAVSPLLDHKNPPGRAFEMFDTLLTSLLLASGSDGIHQVVSTITTFLDSTKSISKQKAAPTPASAPPPPPPV